MVDEEWENHKLVGSEHYKTGGVEPVDLYRAGDMFQDYALTSIIRYAFRNRRQLKPDCQISPKDMDKIIDLAYKLKALTMKEV